MPELIKQLRNRLLTFIKADVVVDDALVEGIVADIIQELRRSGSFEGDDPKTEAFLRHYFVSRLFSDVVEDAPSSQEVIDTFNTVNESNFVLSDSVIAGLEEVNTLWEGTLRAFPSFPRTVDRTREIVREAIFQQHIPGDLFNPNPERRAPFSDDAIAFIDAMENEFIPDFIQNVVDMGFENASLSKVFNNLEVSVAPEARRFPDFETFQATRVAPLQQPAFQVLLDNAGSLLGDGVTTASKIEQLLGGILASRQGIKIGDLDKDTVQADVDRALAIYNAEILTSGDSAAAVLQTVNILLSGGTDIQRRSNRAELQSEIQDRLDKFNTPTNSRSVVTEFLNRLEAKGAVIPAELKEGIIDLLANQLVDYATSFPVQGGQLPQDPGDFLDRLIPQLNQAISGLPPPSISDPTVSQFTQETTDIRDSFTIVDTFLADRGIVLPPEMESIRGYLATQLRTKIASFTGRAGLEEGRAFSTTEFLTSLIEPMQIPVKIAEIVERARAEGETFGFSVDDLDLFLFSHHINMTNRDKFDVMNRVREPGVGIGRALEEVLGQKDRYNRAFEIEQTKTNPVFGIRRSLLRQGVFNEESDPDFVTSIEEIILEIAGDLQDALIVDPDTDVAAFVDEALVKIEPGRLSEQSFLQRRDREARQVSREARQVSLGPLGPDVVPTLGGGFEREPTAPALDPNILQGIFGDQLREGASVGFLNFLLGREKELLGDLQQAQRPSVDQALFDERTQMFSGILGDSGERKFTQEQTRQLALRGSQITPPTAGEFFEGVLPGLKQEFAASPAGVQEELQEELAEKERRRREQERLAEEKRSQSEAVSQRALTSGGRNIFTRIRR